VLSDSALRRRLSAAGRLRVEHFSWSTTARRLADLYAALAVETSL
jgi:glycosyltransferase involved in cell wall biosynthesis